MMGETIAKSVHDPNKPPSEYTSEEKRAIIETSMLETGTKTKVLLVILGLYSLVGLGVYFNQVSRGLIVTDLSHKVFWGLYITNFVFFIGISHAGTLISAILRVTGADWRTPITRMAEEITVIALIFGAASVLMDMGRIDRVLYVFRYTNIDSPLIWDVISISFYLVGSVLFLYLPLIPDFAYYRDNLPDGHKWRKTFYRIFAMGWQNTEDQHHILEKNITKMSFLIIPIAVSVHTVVSWIMSMTWRVGWHSTIFGPYFVVGAIFSGLATLMIAMVLFTHFYHLEVYITKEHFIALTKLLLTFSLFYIYFTLSEYLTIGYTSDTHEIDLLHEVFYGEYAWMFWYFMIGGLFIPSILMIYLIAKPDSSMGIVKLFVFISALLINVGMWFKRYLITVPTLARPALQEGWHEYFPSATELIILTSKISAFIFIFILLSKFFPIISLWEVEEEEMGHSER